MCFDRRTFLNLCVLLGRFLTSDPSILQTKIIEKPLDTQNQSVLVTACLHKCAYMRTQEAAETACTLVRVRVRPRSGSERSSSLTCLEGGKALSLAGPDGGAMHYEFDKVYGVYKGCLFQPLLTLQQRPATTSCKCAYLHSNLSCPLCGSLAGRTQELCVRLTVSLHATGESADQEAVFRDLAFVVDAALAGCNGTVLTYGQTGSGKTHTLFVSVNTHLEKPPWIEDASAVHLSCAFCWPFDHLLILALTCLPPAAWLRAPWVFLVKLASCPVQSHTWARALLQAQLIRARPSG